MSAEQHLTPAERAAAVMASLKDFQRATVEYAFDRLYTSHDPVDRFLVADEVGLGKTMVAKGVIAKAVEHLAPVEDVINIVYICSNQQIARQNLARLNVVGGETLDHADRLTLLPQAMRQLQPGDTDDDGPRINFVSFTPGTSFGVSGGGGAARERVLLYWMLATAWGHEVTGSVRWQKFFEGNVTRERFKDHLAWFKRERLAGVDAETSHLLGAAIDAAQFDGRPLREALVECADRFTYLRKHRPDQELHRERFRLIGALRSLLAHAAVGRLEPDLVILDEFQGFSTLLRDDNDDDDARLARAVFDQPGAKVLLLSATPYKMYTLPGEPDGADHYSDFMNTVTFLAGAAAGRRRRAGLADHARVARERRRARDRSRRPRPGRGGAAAGHGAHRATLLHPRPGRDARSA